MNIVRTCAFAALIVLAGCGDDAGAPSTADSGTRDATSGGSGSSGSSGGSAGGSSSSGSTSSSGGSSGAPTDDGGSPDGSVVTQPDAESDAVGSGPPQAVGGQLFGLTPGESITLQNNSGDNLTLSANGMFTFAKPVAGAYKVTILTPPSSPIAQTCTVWDGSGTIGTAPVTDVRVNCDLLAYYPFSGNAHDESGYGHDGVVSGATATADRNGNANGAYAFGSSATIQAPMPVGFLPVFDQPRTLAAWLKPSGSNNLLDVIFWGEGNCTALQFGLGDEGDHAAFWGGCDDSTSTLPLPVGQWTFVAIVYSPATPTSIALYVNSASATETITALNTGGSAGLLMGGSGGSSTSFTGDIDSVRVYGHALQPAEVASLLTASDP